MLTRIRRFRTYASRVQYFYLSYVTSVRSLRKDSDSEGKTMQNKIFLAVMISLMNFDILVFHDLSGNSSSLAVF